MKTGSRTNTQKRAWAKKHARAKKYLTQVNRGGQDSRTSKFDLMLNGKLKRKKRMIRITKLDFKP